MKRKNSGLTICIALSLVLVGACMVVGAWYALPRLFDKSGKEAPESELASSAGSQSAFNSQTGSQPNLAAASQEYRAVWISYLEFEQMDCSTEENFTASVANRLDNCKQLGLNTVIVQVRPFGDALYPSKLFPYSHLLSGVQGQDPGYDALAILVREAHARGLQIEAWINPYRVQLNAKKPPELALNNPAMLHPEWVKQANGGLYYNPALPEVRQLVVNGVAEILQNYAVDGIHFDDYFYPTANVAFDAELLPAGRDLDDWRRENVNLLLRAVYAKIKEINPAVRFGVSPQGNNKNNYEQQYSDVALWMSEIGYVDYVMPQLYWGFDYRTQSGSAQYAFSEIAGEWAAMPRTSGVSLYLGLGAYRIGEGDGSAAASEEWKSGHNLARMVTALRAMPVQGFAIYRYDSLYANAFEYAAKECGALATVLQ